MKKILSALILPLIVLTSVYAQQPVIKSAPSSNFNDLHAGIEIGPKTIRALVIRVSSAEDDKATIVYSETLVNKATAIVAGKMTPEFIREISQSLKGLSDRLTKSQQVPTDHLYIVGLSDLISDNPGDLNKEIQNQIGKQIQYLSPDVEAQLSTLGIITKQTRQNDTTIDNRSISMHIEIDHSGIKGGYQQLKLSTGGKPNYETSIMTIPKGITEFAAEAGKYIGESYDYKPFVRMLESNSGPVFQNALLEETMKKPGLVTRRKVYLTGNIVWALVTLMYPADTKPFMTITLEDINNFHQRAITDPEALLNPDLSKIRDENVREEVRRDRELIKQLFTPRTLIAGAVMLKHIALDLEFGTRNVTYNRKSGIVRILTYIRVQQDSLK